ncbi:D-alanine--D-serine ligase VanG [Papillibacter cinnamivorans]|uniref:D-alanine--D-alanine ligase n=1 Tax=Papillibacter cinnamivorans DSM 12816 TaxID=1122930 RepID=A0A1W2BES3_9FIRM|nr:D-alanine--D-serine ligase VanG [Papillibacter cinnamivorans]SMC71495.1 D-alanine---D-serine ligase [Papillibacter cinnamivorans DSM 12816]
MEKRNVAVLFGGCSPEYGVSLQSAYSVIQYMDREKYVPVLVGISPEGGWFRFGGDPEKILKDVWCSEDDCLPAAVSPDRAAGRLLVFRGGSVEDVPIDAAFPVLHGKNGEDGTVQGLFELAGIPLVGCGTLASALCMDKDRAHRLVRAAGVSVPASFVLDRNTPASEASARAGSLGYPLYVKPVRAGSSYGITRVQAPAGLPAAVALALEYDKEAILEENIPGFEVGCAVMGNTELTVGEVDEIELSGGFFNFNEKYNLITSAIHVPARIPAAVAAKVKETARTIYRALGCRGFARVDMFLTPAGKIVFNEVNTIPGFTAHSRFPNMMKAAGVPFEKVVSDAIELAVGK